MKISRITKSSVACLFTLSISALIFAAGGGTVNSLPYGEPGPKEAAFNLYKDVPHGVGDESDFVRLRESTGSPTIPAVDNNFVDPLNATCDVGDRFDVRAYIHNSARESKNNDGDGPAVAHDVSLSTGAPIGETGNNFVFEATISSSNAATVTDSGTLNCENEVKLEFVPGSVYVYSQQYGWQNASDSAVNGSMPVGSPEFGVSEVWGCWQYRVVVVYQVEVKEKPVPEEPDEPVRPEEPEPVAPEPERPVPAEPVALPVTGPGSIAGLFAATSAVGAVAYRIILSRRF